MTNPGFGPPTPEGVCRWLVAMDDPSDEVGMAERRTVTLTKISDEARAALETHDQLHTALTELRAASRGLAFFDQIKCARWNAAYQQASRVLGLEDET